MPGTEELMARLQQLEQGYYGDKEAARQQKFFDTYGERFSNNRGLGLAILNELDARGIDTSAADEAVGQILDQLRMECNEIISSIKDVQQTAVENAQKVEEIANVVAQAAAQNPNTDATPTMGAGVEPAEMPPALDAMDPNAEFDPSMVGGAGEEASAEQEKPEEPEQSSAEPEQPAEQEKPEEPEQPPAETLSDSRTKRIAKMKASWGKTKTQKDKEKNGTAGFKPTSGMIEAAQRGF